MSNIKNLRKWMNFAPSTSTKIARHITRRWMKSEGGSFGLLLPWMYDQCVWIQVVDDECMVIPGPPHNWFGSLRKWSNLVQVNEVVDMAKNDQSTFVVAWMQQHMNKETVKTIPIIYKWLYWRENINICWVFGKHGACFICKSFVNLTLLYSMSRYPNM